MGKIYYYDLRQLDAAMECYELALLYDETYVEAYYAYINYALDLYDEITMERLLNKARNVKGINMVWIYYYEAALSELRTDYPRAIYNLKMATQYCRDNEGINYYNAEIARIRAKCTTDEPVKKKPRRFLVR